VPRMKLVAAIRVSSSTARTLPFCSPVSHFEPVSLKGLILPSGSLASIGEKDGRQVATPRGAHP